MQEGHEHVAALLRENGEAGIRLAESGEKVAAERFHNNRWFTKRFDAAMLCWVR